LSQDKRLDAEEAGQASVNILFVAAEVAPFAKVGGLADVAGALPATLKTMGHDVRIVMPAYRMVMERPGLEIHEATPPFAFQVRQGVQRHASVHQTWLPAPRGRQLEPEQRVPVYLIGNPEPQRADGGYFRGAIDSAHVYVYDPEIYIFFCQAVLEMLERLDPAWQPDVIHCNDWHTGLIPVYARERKTVKPTVASHAATLFTIHNLAYQGDFAPSAWRLTDLPDRLYAVEGLEYYGQWSFMKGGLWFSDRVNTVSPTYAREIQTPEYGAGLDGLMRTLAQEGRLSGILNGIDVDAFDPQQDPCLPAHYSAADPSGKAACKTALQSELGLPVCDRAIIGMVTRLADQKGLDLVAAIAEQILELPVQMVVLGQGDPGYEQLFTELQARHPTQMHARIAFDVGLAQRIYAGSDLFLMPSRFEPCGLGQMIALRYGALPIVRATGGLADTIQDYRPGTDNEAPTDGNGFVFSDYTREALLATVERAVAVWEDPAARSQLMRRALSADLAWECSAQEYIKLYHEAANAHRETNASDAVAA
jgi:starch synthase